MNKLSYSPASYAHMGFEDESTDINYVITQKNPSPFTATPKRTMCPSFPLTYKGNEG